MPQIEFGHFYKFVASVGLLMMAAAVALPWVLSQTITGLDLSETAISELTPTARAVLLDRQAAIAVAQNWVLPCSGFIAVAGIALLVWGVWGWIGRQRVADSKEDLDLSKSKAAFDAMSQADVDAKLDEETTESVAEPSAVVVPVGEPSPSSSTAVQSRSRDWEARRDALRSIEEKTAVLLTQKYGSTFSVNSNVRLTTGFASRIDLLLEPVDGSPWGQLAIDVRRTPARLLKARLPEFQMRYAMATNELPLGNVYTGKRGRPSRATSAGILMCVVEDDEGLPSASFEALTTMALRANSVLVRPVGVILISESRFLNLSSLALQDAISTVWAGSATSVVSLI